MYGGYYLMSPGWDVCPQSPSGDRRRVAAATARPLAAATASAAGASPAAVRCYEAPGKSPSWRRSKKLGNFTNKYPQFLRTGNMAGLSPIGESWLKVFKLVNQWIGSRENLNRKPMGFYHQIDRAFRLKFSHHPILWKYDQIWRTNENIKKIII